MSRRFLFTQPSGPRERRLSEKSGMKSPRERRLSEKSGVRSNLERRFSRRGSERRGSSEIRKVLLFFKGFLIEIHSLIWVDNSIFDLKLEFFKLR